MCSSMSHGARITIVYSVSLGVALVLLFAGCISTDNWLPMLGLVPVLFVPVLVVICNYITPFQTQSWEDIGERDRKCAEFGLCGIGMVLSFLLGLPLVLLHAERIDHENFGFWISAMVVAMLGTLYYMYAERKQDDGTRM